MTRRVQPLQLTAMVIIGVVAAIILLILYHGVWLCGPQKTSNKVMGQIYPRTACLCAADGVRGTFRICRYVIRSPSRLGSFCQFRFSPPAWVRSANFDLAPSAGFILPNQPALGEL